ncbi:hypothetical protein [Anaeroselena agilis]|uniref:NADH:flavin oxidoreductase/NADH oxidase N-terminal domain-containing protein n=1 Tax=Anaeroselena agilis TaxID=3063788 RepID=A0ABU3NXN3_9FIRM|nr:hypothetical protein [Selenomonadales bacterium 4137-cl]
MSEILFQPITVNRTVIVNRLAFAAAKDYLDGDTVRRQARYATVAAGGTGLIIAGAADLGNRDGWRAVVGAVHANGGKIMPQLAPLPSDVSAEQPSRLSGGEIAAMICQYADQAAAAKALGADGVEIHAAHNSHCARFLSPLTNTRRDEWGGSLENRLRLHREIYTAVRKKVGDEFPVIIKLGIEDAQPGGLKFAEGRQAAAILATHGYDAIEVSLGLRDHHTAPPFPATPPQSFIIKSHGEARLREWSKDIKALVKKPLILTGGITSPVVAARLVADGYADIVGMCRAVISEPRLVARWHDGDLSPAPCNSCNKCVTELYAKGLPLECHTAKKSLAELLFTPPPPCG